MVVSLAPKFTLGKLSELLGGFGNVARVIPNAPSGKLNLFTIDELFGGLQKAQKIHFSDGGVFDQIQHARR